MFSSIGVLAVDHYAVTTKDLISTLKDFLSIPQAKLLRGPGKNPAQNVNYAFVELNGMGVVEILSPLNETSPILNHINNGGGAYHLCYTVNDLDAAIQTASQKFGAKLVVEPRVDGAFDGRRVAFLAHPLHGLFELIEAYPSTILIDTETAVESIDTSDIRGEIQNIYRDIVGVNVEHFASVTMESNPEWDSLKHLLLIMEIEKQFEISITASEMSELTSLVKLENHLRNK
ncbi:hypothetical protein NM06_17935 [Vibrio sinaloensis]|uniref:VOC domain-containing protein n=2 Tax=Photobacterium sp. (strain ATCC 43367) TaxID=379097 RepID=A0A0A5HP24_PHOS4|nr:hypothetical protein NM06_17935 [Vibrio sinaloensis]